MEKSVSYRFKLLKVMTGFFVIVCAIGAWLYYGGAVDRSCLDTREVAAKLKRVGQMDVQGEFNWQLEQVDVELWSLNLEPTNKFKVESDTFYENTHFSTLFSGSRFIREFNLSIYSFPYIYFEYVKEYNCSGNVVFENVELRTMSYSQSEIDRQLKDLEIFEVSRLRPLLSSIGVTRLQDVLLEVTGEKY